MIYGIGVDTATTARVAKSVQRASFLEKVFGAQERVLFARHHNNADTMAANFAAKEAFGKALGAGIFSGLFDLSEVQALRGESGAPYLAFSGKAAVLIAEKRLRTHLSLTHEGGVATAFVVLEIADTAEQLSQV
ncbi:MAG: holo-ACP synthase [Ruthenibacterium sp.]